MDDSIIERFISLHGISLANDEEDGAYVETVCELADENVVENVEGVDSSNKDEVTVVDSWKKSMELIPLIRTMSL